MNPSCRTVPFALVACFALLGCFRDHGATPGEIRCCDGRRTFTTTGFCPMGSWPVASGGTCTALDAGTDALDPFDAPPACMPDPDARCCDGAREVTPTSRCPFECPPGSMYSTDICEGPVLECPDVRADAACAFPTVIEAGAPFVLPMEFHTCGCCIDTECRLDRVYPDEQRVVLTTTMCPDPCDCDSCIMPRVNCDIPALDEGRWTIEVNDVEAFTLEVQPPSPAFAEWPDRCVAFAEADECSGERGTLARTRPIRRIDQICVEPSPFEDFSWVSVAHFCSTCGVLDGPCTVDLQTRYTDDLPPGGEIHVSVTRHDTLCDVDCPDVCMLDEQRCAMPQLEPGHFYRVHLDGEVVHSFTYEPGSGDACVTF